MNFKNFLLVITMTTAATSMQAMQQGAGAPQGAVQAFVAMQQQAADAGTGVWLLSKGLTEIWGFCAEPTNWAQLPLGAGMIYASVQEPDIAMAAGIVSTRIKARIGNAWHACTTALKSQVVIDDAIEKTMKLIAASDNEPLSEEEQMKAYTVEVLPLLALYEELGGLVKEFKHSEESKKNAEEVALEISKGKTAKTFRALFATYLAKGDRRLGIKAELGAVLAGLERPCKV